MSIRETKASTQSPPNDDNIMLGIFMGLTAFFLLAVMGAFAKLLSENHNVIEIAFYRNMTGCIPLILYIVSNKKWTLLHVNNKTMMLVRVVFGTATLFMTYTGLKLLPIADCTVLFMTANLIAPMLAVLLLKEDMGWRRWVAVIVGFMGVILVASPTGQVAPLGVVIALIAACGHAVVNTILRFLKNENALTVTFYFVSGGMIISGIFMPWIAAPILPHEIFWFIGVGISGSLAQYFLTAAFKYAPSSVISPFNYTGLLWATGLDILIWKHIPGWHVFIGGAIIISAKLYIIVREKQKKNKTY